MFGFRFDEDDAAAEFYQRLNDKAFIKSQSSSLPPTFSGRDHSFTAKAKANKHTKKRKPSLSRKSPISASMISAPAFGSFLHAAHVGISETGNMEATGTLDPSWNTIVGDLRSDGVDPRMVEGNADFVQGFLAGYKAAKANPASDDECEILALFMNRNVK